MTTHVSLLDEKGTARVRFESESGIPLLDATARQELSGVISQLESRRDVRVVVFESLGRAFLAGADIRELRELHRDAALQLAHETHELFGRVATLPAVTLAAIHGACAGGGFELALCCDLRFAAESAKIGLPEVSLGLIPGWGGTVRMTRMFGAAVALQVILRGELLSAAEALSLRIISGVMADEGFADGLQHHVQTILRKSPGALRAAKSLIRSLSQRDLRADLAMEARLFAECYNSPEAHEGTTAFLEKRPPRWED